MDPNQTAFVFTVLLAILASAIGVALYRYGMAYVRYRGIRVGGGVAVAGLAFCLMAWFYFEQIARDQPTKREKDQVIEAVVEYNTCVVHEAGFACKHQADDLRDVCERLAR